MLQMLGAEVSGYALAPDTEPAHFDLLKFKMNSMIGDIREPRTLVEFFKKTQPEVVFHMAAQPLVLKSYEDPRGTYETNVMGTLNVLEAVRMLPSVRAVVVVTSDKAYENRETTVPETYSAGETGRSIDSSRTSRALIRRNAKSC